MKHFPATAFLLICLAVFAFSACILQAADVPPASLRETVNALDAAQVDKAIDALQSNFLSPAALDPGSKQKALLEGLVRRLSPGVSIVSSENARLDAAPTPFLAEILDDRAGYIRPGKLDSATLSQLDVTLASFAEKKLPAVILDLRAVPGGSEFEAAADFARRFCPKGKMLFSIQKPSAKQERILTSNQNPSYEGILVVLTDPDTSGAAEALAATLRVNAGAMIVGSDTAGEAVEFLEIPLGAGKILRVAVSQVVLPDKAALFPGGVKPDIAISLPAGTLEDIFAASREKGVSQFVFDSERPRMSEAALVANTNPEIESTKERAAAPLRDTVLQRAMDLVTAIHFYKQQK
ncbi:MAG: S41 family peptidase [Terrimicrobiaceae bacterium]